MSLAPASLCLASPLAGLEALSESVTARMLDGEFNCEADVDLTVGAIVAAILHTGLARLAHEGMAAEPRRTAQTPAE